jgi:integrase/recombinase XerD
MRDKLLYLLLATTGLRISEATNLNWGDIDFKNGYLIVRQGKGKRDRIVPMVNEVLYLLSNWKRQGRWVKQPKNPVFRNPRHHPRGKVRMKTGTIDDQLHRHLIYCDIHKKAGCHAFRHSFATQMLTSGVDPQTLATLAGWKSLRMLSVYVHLDVDHLKEAVNKHPLNHTAPFLV